MKTKKKNHRKEIEDLIGWVTPDCSSKFQGPGVTGGFLVLNFGVKGMDYYSYTCTKLVLNPTEKKEIKAPSREKTLPRGI